MRYFIALCVFAVFGFGAEPDEILAVINKTFRAMMTRDEAMLRSTMLADARLYSMRGDGVGSRSIDEFAKQIAAGKVDLVERFTDRPQVSIRGKMAQVWGEYEFLRDGKFSHCGVDTVVLFKTAEGWQIGTLSYTVEPMGCKSK